MNEDEARHELERELERPEFQRNPEYIAWLRHGLAWIQLMRFMEERQSEDRFERELRDLGVID